jgi:hypothetical protein
MEHQASCCLLYELACRKDTVHLLNKHGTATLYWLTCDAGSSDEYPGGLWVDDDHHILRRTLRKHHILTGPVTENEVYAYTALGYVYVCACISYFVQ